VSVRGGGGKRKEDMAVVPRPSGPRGLACSRGGPAAGPPASGHGTRSTVHCHYKFDGVPSSPSRWACGPSEEALAADARKRDAPLALARVCSLSPSPMPLAPNAFPPLQIPPRPTPHACSPAGQPSLPGSEWCPGCPDPVWERGEEEEKIGERGKETACRDGAMGEGGGARRRFYRTPLPRPIHPHDAPAGHQNLPGRLGGGPWCRGGVVVGCEKKKEERRTKRRRAGDEEMSKAVLSPPPTDQRRLEEREGALPRQHTHTLTHPPPHPPPLSCLPPFHPPPPAARFSASICALRAR